MRIVSSSNEHEMVYEFLKMEISSDRYSKQILDILDDMHISRDIIIDGNVSSGQENALRAEILGRFRGFKKNEGLFENFPMHIDWCWTIFENDDITKIVYINYSYWNEISNYTGSPIEAAKMILMGKTVYDVPNDGFFQAFQSLKNGMVFPPVILLTDIIESRYVILEGHKRMTAYGFDPRLFQDVTVLLGYCKSDELKKWYGEMPTCTI